MVIPQNCLILGYGRAGKRHKINAEKLGMRVFTYDPNLQDVDFTETYTMPFFLFDYAVIASPPEKHLEQIELLYNNGITKILCEKPLCSISEKEFLMLSPDLDILVAYNWYYNKEVQEMRYKYKDYNLFAEQSRELPYWGIENDHLPHDLFIIDYVSGGITDIKSVDLVKSQNHQEVYVEGKTKTGNFYITERVLARETPRISKINGIDIIPSSTMFDDMWVNFINGKYKPSLKDGIKIQNLLLEINDNLQRKVII